MASCVTCRSPILLLFVLLIDRFVIDLSLFYLYNDWLHGLARSEFIGCYHLMLCIRYVLIWPVIQKKLLLIIWTTRVSVWVSDWCSETTAAGHIHLRCGRGVSAPIFLVVVCSKTETSGWGELLLLLLSYSQADAEAQHILSRPTLMGTGRPPLCRDISDGPFAKDRANNPRRAPSKKNIGVFSFGYLD